MTPEEFERINLYEWLTPAQREAALARWVEKQKAETPPPRLEYECERCGSRIEDGEGDLSVSTALAEVAFRTSGPVERWLVSHTTCRVELQHQGQAADRLILPVESMRRPFQVIDAWEYFSEEPWDAMLYGTDWDLLRREIAGKGVRP